MSEIKIENLDSEQLQQLKEKVNEQLKKTGRPDLKVVSHVYNDSYIKLINKHGLAILTIDFKNKKITGANNRLLESINVVKKRIKSYNAFIEGKLDDLIVVSALKSFYNALDQRDYTRILENKEFFELLEVTVKHKKTFMFAWYGRSNVLFDGSKIRITDDDCLKKVKKLIVQTISLMPEKSKAFYLGLTLHAEDNKPVIISGLPPMQNKFFMEFFKLLLQKKPDNAIYVLNLIWENFYRYSTKDFIAFFEKMTTPYKMHKYLNYSLQNQALSPDYRTMELWHDYLDMCFQMDVKNYPIYTNKLLTHHKLIEMNYRIQINEVKENNYIRIYNAKARFFNKKIAGYTFIFPKKLTDIVKEGNDMHHCVASYVDKVCDERSFIVFMRKKANESLVTLEMSPNGSVIQAKCENNHEPNPELKKIIKEYEKLISGDLKC